MKAFFTQEDQAAAAAYWQGKPAKVFAVDMEAGPINGKPTFSATSYCRARSALRAVEAIKRHGVHEVRGVRYRVRLAGPVELGCIATGAKA
jgi:hypothetical protein